MISAHTNIFRKFHDLRTRVCQRLVTGCLFLLVFMSPAFGKNALVHCNPIALGKSTIQFARFNYKSSAWYEQIKFYGTHLYFSDVYAISKDVVFLSGGLYVPGGVIRSVVIRSQNGGKHWREVKAPQAYHSSSNIIFLDRLNGRLMDTESCEGACPSKLYITTDGGISWKQRGGILPFQGGGSYMTLDLSFSSLKNGSIWSERDTTDPARYDGRDICRFDTTDGGFSWKTAKVCYPYDTYMFHRKTPEWVDSLTDKSQWKLEKYQIDLSRGRVEDDSLFLVYRRSESTSPWEIIMVIPASLKLEANHGCFPFE